MKSAGKELNLNHKEGMVSKKGTQIPLGKVTLLKETQDGIPKV